MAIKNGRYKDKNGNVRHFETNENMIVVDNGEKTLKQKLASLLESFSDLIKRFTAHEISETAHEDIRNNVEVVKGGLSDRGQLGRTKSISGTDLNTLMTSGEYHGNTLGNSPTEVGTATCFVTVTALDNLYVWQRLKRVTNWNVTWERCLVNGVWSEWQKIATTDVTDVVNNDGKIKQQWQIQHGYRGRFFSEIFPSGSNLDDIKTNVFCYTQGGDNLVNIPSGSPSSSNSYFECKCNYLSDGSVYTVEQIYTRIDVGTWKRVFSGANKVWSEWEQIAFTKKTISVPLLNGWSTVGTSDWDSLSVAISGNVGVLNARIKNTSQIVNGNVIATLPEGYRPTYNERVIGFVGDNGATTAAFDIKTDGSIVWYGGTYSSISQFRINGLAYQL